MTDQTASFGVRLAQLRRDAGLSQQELAQMLSVTRQAVSNWERDQTAPDLDMLCSLATALGTDPNTLCGVEVPPHRKPRRKLPRPVLALSLCAAFCLGAGLGLRSNNTAPVPVPIPAPSAALSAHQTSDITPNSTVPAAPSTTLPIYRVSYTTSDGLTVTTDADGAQIAAAALTSLPEQDPGPVELTPRLRSDFRYFAQQYVLRFLPDYQNGAFLSAWDDVLLWCYRSGCSNGGIMTPQLVEDYLAQSFGYTGDLPARGTEHFPLEQEGYYPECGPFTTTGDVYTLSRLELLEDGTWKTQLRVEPYDMLLDLILSPTESGLCIHASHRTYDA